MLYLYVSSLKSLGFLKKKKTNKLLSYCLSSGSASLLWLEGELGMNIGLRGLFPREFCDK